MDTCRPEWNERLSAWFDGEAADAEDRAAQTHLRSCLVCRRVVEEWKRLRQGMRAERALEPVRLPRLRRPLAWGMVALLAVGFVGAWSLRAQKITLMDELEQHHFQAFAQTSPCEFQSSDPTQVRDWLRQKVGYQVEVPELPGATLLGARRCKLDGVLSASLLFRRGNAAVTVFVPPPDGTLAPAFARLTDGSGRCVMGRLGERVCSSHRSDALAVANADPATVVAFADATSR